MSDENKKIYELGYNILPTVSEEDVAKTVGAFKDALAKMGAEMIVDQYPQMINLAYEMVKEIENKNRKFKNAFFGWMKFELAASELEAFKTLVEKNANILRFLIIKTVRESTLAVPKIAHKGMTRRPAAGAEHAAPMDETAVDKKIDEIIDQNLGEDLK